MLRRNVTNRVFAVQTSPCISFGRPSHPSRLTSPLTAPSALAPAFAPVAPRDPRSSANHHPTEWLAPNNEPERRISLPSEHSWKSDLDNSRKMCTYAPVTRKCSRMNTSENCVGGGGRQYVAFRPCGFFERGRPLCARVAATSGPASLVFRVPHSLRFVQRVGFAFGESPVRDDTVVAQCGSTGNHCGKQIEAPEGRHNKVAQNEHLRKKGEGGYRRFYLSFPLL